MMGVSVLPRAEKDIYMVMEVRRDQIGYETTNRRPIRPHVPTNTYRYFLHGVDHATVNTRC